MTEKVIKGGKLLLTLTWRNWYISANIHVHEQENETEKKKKEKNKGRFEWVWCYMSHNSTLSKCSFSFSLYGPLSFCRQIKAKENKSNFQKSIGEKVNIPVSCTHSPINISSFTLPCLLHNINSSLRSLYYLVSSSFCRENNDNDNDRVK